MKKLRYFFLMAVLAVVLCVPTLAADDCERDWSDGLCTICDEECVHSWSDGVCDICGYGCYHPSMPDGWCSDCDYACEHSFSVDGLCSICGCECVHSWNTLGECVICGLICYHADMVDGFCPVCGLVCDHSFYWDDFSGIHYCELCGYSESHSYSSLDGDGHRCLLCSYVEGCTFEEGVCTFCGYVCDHDAWDAGWCARCNEPCTHEFVDGFCRICYSGDLSLYLCEHFYEISAGDFVLYIETDLDHYVGCLICNASMPGLDFFSLLSGVDPSQITDDMRIAFKHSGDDCDFPGCNVSALSQVVGMTCSHWLLDPTIYVCADEHYAYCKECGYYRLLIDAYALEAATDYSDPGHYAGDDVCMLASVYFVELGIEYDVVVTDLSAPEYFAPSVFENVTSGVSSAASWVGTYANTIAAHPLLLSGCILTFVGFAALLLKRLLNR